MVARRNEIVHPLGVMQPACRRRIVDDFDNRAENGRGDGNPMTDATTDDLGPVDYLVVEFPAGQSNFTGEMAAELAVFEPCGHHCRARPARAS